MAHNYCKCGGNKGSCIDCAEEEIDRLTAQLAEARAEVRQVEQSAINFHEAWQQALNDLESARNDMAEALRSCNEAWSEATGGNYPAHAEKIIEALRSSVQFWKDETRRSVDAGDLAYVKAMRHYATMVAENEELKETVKQVEQSAINFHEAWQQALNDLESVRHEEPV